MKHAKWRYLACAAAVSAAAGAVDLPWTYDTSGRTVVEAKSTAAVGHSGAFATMAGHWSYVSTTSHLRTVPWKGITIIFR